MRSFTPELVAKAKEAKSTEKLLELARENNVEMTEEEAETCFSQLNGSGAVSDDELNVVAGGGCGSDDEEKEEVKVEDTSFKPGDRVKVNSKGCPTCCCRYGSYSLASVKNFYTVHCERCGSIIIYSADTSYIQKV